MPNDGARKPDLRPRSSGKSSHGVYMIGTLLKYSTTLRAVPTMRVWSMSSSVIPSSHWSYAVHVVYVASFAS